MVDFRLYPAIDLRRGRVVRLWQGDPTRETAFAEDPAAVAETWLQAGARWLHVVNLDAAFGEDDAANRRALDAVLAVAEKHRAAVQWGGGVRSPEQAAYWLRRGVQRVVVGSLAVRAPATVAALVAQWGPTRVAVGLDARDGKLRTHGWQTGVALRAVDLAATLGAQGVQVFIVTDIARDGTGRGPNLALAQAVAQAAGPKAQVIASGGVRTLDHILAAAQAGLAGIVVGRALYEGTLSLQAALKALRQRAAGPSSP